MKEYSGLHDINHQFSIECSMSKVMENWEWYFVRKIQKLFGDSNAKNIIVLKISQTPYTFSWTNSSLTHEPLCPKFEILNLFSTLGEGEMKDKCQTVFYSPSSDLKQLLEDHIHVKSISLSYHKKCSTCKTLKVVEYDVIKDTTIALALIPPVEVFAKVLSSTSIYLTWVDPNSLLNQSDIWCYAIRYKSMSSDDLQYSYYNTSHQSFMLQNLQAATNYEFAVRIVNDQNQSPWSFTIYNKTLISEKDEEYYTVFEFGSNCSVPCGPGVKTITTLSCKRRCPLNSKCCQRIVKEINCLISKCKNVYSSWSSWSECTKPCISDVNEKFFKTRSRTCLGCKGEIDGKQKML